MRKTKKWCEDERERERAIQSPHTTRGNNNELIMLQVKAKKGADEVEVEESRKNCCGSSSSSRNTQASSSLAKKEAGCVAPRDGHHKNSVAK